MVKQTCDVMQLYAYMSASLPAFISLLRNVCSVLSFSTSIRYPENKAWTSEINTAFLVESWCWLLESMLFFCREQWKHAGMSYLLLHYESSLKMEKAFSLALFSPVIIVCFTEEKATSWWCYSVNRKCIYGHAHMQTCTRTV